MSNVRAFAVVLAALFAFESPCPAAGEPGDVRILFAGSSSTYMHNLPLKVARCLEELGAYKTVKAHLVGKSGTGVHVYLRPGFEAQYGLDRGETILEHIARERYDLVVLQMVTEFIAGEEGEEFDRAVDVYCKAIRDAGGEPVFYEMGWGRGEPNDKGQELVLRAAARNGVRKLAPCSTAWERVRRDQPDLELHNLPDTAHPGTLGHYLNLCCFVAALTGKPPDKVPPTVTAWPRFGSFDKDEADRRLAELKAQRKLDDYEASLPGFLQRMTAMQSRERIDGETAAALQRAAWESWKEAQERLE